jgi:hypothetical protein
MIQATIVRVRKPETFSAPEPPGSERYVNHRDFEARGRQRIIDKRPTQHRMNTRISHGKSKNCCGFHSVVLFINSTSSLGVQEARSLPSLPVIKQKMDFENLKTTVSFFQILNQDGINRFTTEKVGIFERGRLGVQSNCSAIRFTDPRRHPAQLEQ